MHIPFRRFSRARGFTLIELLIVMAIIAILTAIAYPSYIQYVRKSRRTDAKNALLDLAAREERFFSMNNVYTSTPANLGYGGAFPLNVQSGNIAYYQLNVNTAADPSGSITTYAATATPIAGSAQAGDPCGTYNVNQLGQQTNTNNTQTTGCW